MPDQIILDGMNVGDYQVKYPASGILSDVGVAGGVATLDANGKIPTSQIPSGGGGSGTSNYNDLENKPQIGGTTLTGNKTLNDLGIASAGDVSAKYTKPSSGIPASDLASGVIPDVSGKADKADTVLDTTLSMGRKSNTTVGNKSTALGSSVEASNSYAFGEGYNTKASGRASHAGGESSQAVGNDSYAYGVGVSADGDTETVIGSYNKNGTPISEWVSGTSYKVGDLVTHDLLVYKCVIATSETTWSGTPRWARVNYSTKEAFVIGNGSGSSEKSNAFEVYWDGTVKASGEVYANGKQLAHAEDVAGKIDEPATEGTAGQVLTTDGNGGRVWTTPSGGGSGGTSNYNDLLNKPQIGGVTLSGNKTLSDLGIYGVPSGGSANQVLAKNSGTNYDLKWVTVSGGGSSGGTYSGLEGKNVVFFGDSISYGEGNNGHSYIDIIDEMGICASLVKEAHTSSCVGPYNVYSDANGYDLISMIQLRATDIANADVVFCGYCGNDSDSLAHNLIQLGYPEDPSTANTICGYTRRAIENIRAINPLVRIVWLFARMSNFTFLRDSTSTSYVSADYLIPTVKAMSEVCSDNNVTYGSQYDGLYLDKQHGHILNDIAGHPTELGHTLIAETILHEYPFSVRPYEPVKHVTLNNDGTYNSTFAVLLLHAQHDIDIFVHYQGLVFRQKAYSSSGLLFESEGMASSSASTRYLLSITSSGASLYTTPSTLTSVPWGGGGGGGDGVIYDGSVTIRTDSGGVNYCTINTSEPISADETWTVVWNGTTYTLQSKYVTTLGPSDISAYCIGNVDIEDGEDDGSGVPFYAYKYQANVMAFGTTDPTGTITLRVVKGSSGSSDYVTYFDGNITVVTDNPSYFVINNYTYPFGANETYRITWDTGGTQYMCTTRQAGDGQAFDGYGLGNAGLVGGTDTGEPFLMYRDSATRLVSVTNHAAGTVHVKIEKYVGSSGT